MGASWADRPYDPEYKGRKKIIIQGNLPFFNNVTTLIAQWIWWSITGRAIMKEILELNKPVKLDLIEFGNVDNPEAAAQRPQDAYAYNVPMVKQNESIRDVDVCWERDTKYYNPLNPLDCGR